MMKADLIGTKKKPGKYHGEEEVKQKKNIITIINYNKYNSLGITERQRS